jgi:uncharacterized protein with HEPN domain
MRREELYLRDIVEAANHIAGFIAGLDPMSFQESELVRSAVAQKLAIIGEAAARVSDEMKYGWRRAGRRPSCGIRLPRF